MNNKLIERYIQFAIDNGYENFYPLFTIASPGDKYFMPTENEDNYIQISTESSEVFSLIEVITSKDFIEAITRGVVKKYYQNGNLIEKTILMGDKSAVEYFTHNQADAIRDGNLESFIKDLI